MRTRRLVAVLLLALAGCSCPKTDSTTPDPGVAGADRHGGKPTETTVVPLKLKEVAKKQDQALILGTKNGAVTIPLAGRESAVGIEVMWVRDGQGRVPTIGGASPATMVTTPTGAINSDGKVRVGVYEQYAGGAGPQMRSAVWIAAFVAATTLGKDLTDYKFAAESEGFVDGPSAGGLMTAGFLASLTGVKVDPEATMTGTVNPDGTIGPVGGIPHKFEGSIARGKKRLGYPIGMRTQRDMNTNTDVDLQEVAKAGGAQAVEISDIYEAYELMTGQKLPVPEPLDERDMALPEEVDERLTEKYEAWVRLYEAHAKQITELVRTGNLPAGLKQYVTWADDEHTGAQAMMRQGLPAAAYYKIVRATVYAATATTVDDVLDLVAAGKLDQASARLQREQSTQNETVMTLAEIGTMAPGTISDHLLEMSAFAMGIAAFGHQMWGIQAMNGALAYVGQVAQMQPVDQASPEVRDQLVETITAPILMLTRGQAFALAAREALEIEAESGLTYKCSLPNAKRLSKSFGSAAAADLGYFDSVIVDEYAKHYEVSRADMQEKFRGFEPKYLVARWAFDLPRILSSHFEWGDDSLPAVLAMLSGAILSYQSSSSLIAEYYSLGVQPDERGDVHVKQEKAFMNMLASAERKSREYAHAAQVAVGQVPVQSKIAYQNARVLREGTTREKLRALEFFWQSSVYSQVAVMLARNY